MLLIYEKGGEPIGKYYFLHIIQPTITLYESSKIKGEE